MIFVSGSTNSISYYSRYGQVDKFEILDHSSRIVTSGTTTIIANGNKITHSGLTYNFETNDVFTYKSYYLSDGVYYIVNQSLLKSFNENTEMMGSWKTWTKVKNTFKAFRYIIRGIYDGGSASFVSDNILDAGTADSVGDNIFDAGEAME